MALFPSLDPRLDWLLRFPDEIEALHEAETRHRRVATLRRSIFVGLPLYNIYNLTAAFLVSDVFWVATAVRVLYMTPLALFLAWLAPHVGGCLRERLAFVGVAQASIMPLATFWLSREPNAVFTFGEIALMMVFASMMLPLRFRYALTFTLCGFACTGFAAFTKPGLPIELSTALFLQFVTAGFLTIYANWQMESLRCLSFLGDLDARRKVEGAELRSRELEILSDIDALTGLPNRRALDATLHRLFAEGRPLGVLMVDVDFFKLYNDRLGHPEGDACLKAIAGRLSDLAAASGAIAARFGGEEFTILLPDRGESECMRLAEGLVEGVRGLAIPHPSGFVALGIVTVSVGLAIVEEPARSSPAEALAKADDALYHVKRQGRNHWALAGASGEAPPAGRASEGPGLALALAGQAAF